MLAFYLGLYMIGYGLSLFFMLRVARMKTTAWDSTGIVLAAALGSLFWFITVWWVVSYMLEGEGE